MSRYIKVEDAIEAAINGCASWDGGYFASMDGPIKEEFDAVADKCIELVRCGECKHWTRIDSPKGNGKCEFQWHLTREDFYCADGERIDKDANVLCNGERKDGESDGRTTEAD